MRRWLQFRISTLLWLIVACAIAFGWWRDHAVQQRKAAALAVSKLSPRDEALQALTLAFGKEADQASKLHLALLLAELDEPEE